MEDKQVAVYINGKGVLNKLAEILDDDNVYISKMDAIPKGEERKILEKLIS